MVAGLRDATGAEFMALARGKHDVDGTQLSQFGQHAPRLIAQPGALTELAQDLPDAEGKYQAAEKLRNAAAMIEDHPMAMQMRFLQALVDVGAENNSTIVFPVPLELGRTFSQLATRSNGKPARGPSQRILGSSRGPAGEVKTQTTQIIADRRRAPARNADRWRSIRTSNSTHQFFFCGHLRNLRFEYVAGEGAIRPAEREPETA